MNPNDAKRFIYGPRWRKYEAMKQAWIAANRNATPEQYQRAMAQIAKRCGV